MFLDHKDWTGCQVTDNWWLTKDGDPQARELFDRHYSRYHYRDGRKPKLFVGPGFKMVLVSYHGGYPNTMQGGVDALFVWRDAIQADGQDGACCSIFRNEGFTQSSRLILEAEEFCIMSDWIPARFFTYVNAAKVTSSNPGYCFKRAGWSTCGTTKGGLVILEKDAAKGGL